MKISEPLVYIVTPVFNDIVHTRLFLQSVKKQTYPNFKVVIVDDGSADGSGSADGTPEMIKTEFPDTILVFGEDKKWSDSTNKGVKRAIKDGAEYVLTINNDVEVKPNYISSLVQVAQTHPDSLIGSMVVYQNDKDKVWYAGATFDTKTGNLSHRTGKVKQFLGLLSSEWLTGMGVLIPTAVFERIGYYNAQDFPQYYGDADFSVRARQAGYNLLVNTSSVVVAD